jgi:phage-related protein
MDANWTVVPYRFANGQVPYEGFLDALPSDARKEALALQSLLQRAHVLRMPLSKALARGLFELRGPRCGVRIFYVFRPGRRVVILDGYVKKRQDIPCGVLRLMRKYKADLERNDESKEI